MQKSQRLNFLRWYDLAKIVLGDLMPERSDAVIQICLFESDVMVLPLPRETTKEEIANRADPSICVIDRPHQENIEILLQCNTLKSVEKLRNILDLHQQKQKADLLEGLSKLDSDFKTIVYSKQKQYNFGQSPSYLIDQAYSSRTITERDFDLLFRRVDEIRKAGIDQKLLMNRRDPPELPAIGIARVSISRDENIFQQKIQQIKPIYRATLEVKTDSELRKIVKAEAKAKRLEPSIVCSRCEEKYSREEYTESRFCRKCGNRLIFVRQ
ncbi:MAG: hypothetical protein ACYCQJ_10805 [Nitrososphaerales archaeon]